MGREVHRVPLDFDWPLNEPWKGYVRPAELELPRCPDCTLGYAPYAQRLHDTFYPFQAGSREAAWHDKLTQDEVDLLVEHGGLPKWIDGKWTKVPRTADEVNETQRTGTILDQLTVGDCYRVMERRCQQAGEPFECPTCGGSAEVGTPKQRAAHEAWERTGPPPGDGWQLWETVSEGSPISPVFDSPEGLAAWMASPDRRDPWRYDAALKWIVEVGWAPSGIFVRVNREDGGS